MLWTIIIILLVLWLLGGFVRPVGGFIHILLVVILILVLIQIL
ncbi:MAG: lmo0937 family membrane protein [Gemmatimonadetes bacterium]|nr:lmo0937 family membrane protein [Gemmatimonadota bacterium]